MTLRVGLRMSLPSIRRLHDVRRRIRVRLVNRWLLGVGFFYFFGAALRLLVGHRVLCVSACATLLRTR